MERNNPNSHPPSGPNTPITIDLAMWMELKAEVTRISTTIDRLSHELMGNGRPGHIGTIYERVTMAENNATEQHRKLDQRLSRMEQGYKTDRRLGLLVLGAILALFQNWERITTLFAMAKPQP